MVCLATPLIYAALRFLGKDLLVGLPEIAEAQAALVLVGDLVPQAATSPFAAVADHKGHNLACAATNSGPQPAFSTLFQHKRPELIDFKDITWLGGHQGIFQVRQSPHNCLDPASQVVYLNTADNLLSSAGGGISYALSSWRAYDNLPLDFCSDISERWTLTDRIGYNGVASSTCLGSQR